MPAVRGDGMRGLAVFISDIRNCKSKEAEIKRINKELANIRSKFKVSCCHKTWPQNKAVAPEPGLTFIESYPSVSVTCWDLKRICGRATRLWMVTRRRNMCASCCLYSCSATTSTSARSRQSTCCPQTSTPRSRLWVYKTIEQSY